jgi:hypothetical protein
MLRRPEGPSRSMGPPHPSRRVLRTPLRMRGVRGCLGATIPCVLNQFARMAGRSRRPHLDPATKAQGQRSMRDLVASRMRRQRLLIGRQIRRPLDARGIQLLRAFRTINVLNDTRHGRERARRLGSHALLASMAIVICCRHTNTPTQTSARRIALMTDNDRNVLINRNCGSQLPASANLVLGCRKNPRPSSIFAGVRCADRDFRRYRIN